MIPSRIVRKGQGRVSRLIQAVLVAFSGAVLAGCDLDSLLSVELPGVVEANDLNSPSFATTLVRSARGDFECFLSSYIYHIDGLWTTGFHSASTGRNTVVIALRHPSTRDYDALEGGVFNQHCRQIAGLPTYGAGHVARVQAKNAIEIISQFDQSELADNKDYLLGEAYFYRGYATQILSETYCSLTFDGGPVETREQGFARADEDFATAREYLLRVTSGPNAARAQQVAMAALVGRARAHLNLGNAAEVVQYASQVPLDFVFLADRSAGGGAQTQNTIFNQSNPNSFQASVAEPWRDLTVDGVPDPRVPVQDMGGPVGPDNMTDIWVQLKYRSNADPIPFATGREAALMIAEVTGGQTAVDIINTLRSTYSLPQFSSTDENEIRATVIEERKRELWLQGTRIGDMLRLNLPWVTGRSPRGDFYGDYTCVPLPRAEELGNDNM